MRKENRFVSIRSRIMTITIIPVIVSFFLLILVVFIPLLNSLNETARATFRQVSQKYAHSFERKINNALNYLSIISSELEEQVRTGATDREALQATVLNVFNGYGLIDGSSVYFESGLYDDRDAQYRATKYGTVTSGRICWYFYKDGGQTAYLPEGLANDIEFELPHYTDAKQANAPIYTDPVVYEVDGKDIAMFTLTYPIKNAGGEFIGAVTVDLFLDDIYAQLQEERIYDTGYIVIWNGNGKVIYSPRYGDIGSNRITAGFDYQIPADAGATTFFNAKTYDSGKNALVTVDSVYIPLLNASFYISVAAPLTEINADGAALLVLLIALCLVIIGAITALVFFLIAKISAPLKEITAGVDKIASGDYHARITGKYDGEFAMVKDSVNTMADSIEAYILAYDSSFTMMKSIFNGLEAYLYVTDPANDEMLFVNDNLKKLLSIESDGVGKKCWEVLKYNTDSRCAFCPCKTLDHNPSEPHVWEEYNAISDRYYRNNDRYIDWVNGKRAHLQHSVDITDIKLAQLALDRRLQQQALMTSISQSFLTDTDFDTLIANTLRAAGEFLNVSQVMFYKLDYDRYTFECQNEWIDPALGLPSRIGGRLMMTDSVIALLDSLWDGKDFCITSDDDRYKSAMAPYRINFHNYIMAPIYFNNRIYATLDFSKSDAGAGWSDSDINLVTFIASLLSGYFAKQTMEGQVRRLSSIVESSPQLIMNVRSDGTVDYVNPAAATITGYSIAELLQGGLDILFDSQTTAEFKNEYIPRTYREGSCSFEISMICKDDLRRIMAFSSFITGAGSTNVSCIASDVTEIRRLEADLIASKELAEQGSRSKSEFLSRMSHEMRTPMNAIIGMTNIAKSSGDLEKKEYCLDRIDNASRHLLGVINDILDMSKIEANKFDLSFSDFSFEHMLLNVLNVVNFRVEERRQDLSIFIDPAFPDCIEGDEQRLAQVITNLLTNAVKFTPEHGVIRLKASIDSMDEGLYTLKIEIIDSGIGISKEQQARLFHSFEQADGSIARKFGGTGLGLAISKRIVELMGGQIWVTSELGSGSVFGFTIKARKGTSLARENIGKRINIHNLHVLAVDDSPEVCEYFTHVMEGMGIRCSVALSGSEALEQYGGTAERFDIVFADWKMPGMNGIELTRELRKLPGTKPIIIMISVAEWSDIEREAIDAGVNGFLPKPLFPSQLLDCICTHLNVETEEESKIEQVALSFEGKTILLAEDVDINREIILSVLEDTHLVIDCAENGLEAVEMFTTNPGKYDLILMDIHMPEVDGLEATRRIRALPMPEGARTPIVAMTASVFREDIMSCLDAGMNDHIGKPIDFDELYAKLRKFLL